MNRANKKPKSLIFDLDDTLYPKKCDLMGEVSRRITMYIEQKFNYSYEKADKMRWDYRVQYGSSLVGLMLIDGVSHGEYTKFVYDIKYGDFIDLNADLDYMLKSLPQDKIIYTNGAEMHAKSVLSVLGISHHFSQIVGIEKALFYGKPTLQSYREMLRHTGVVASESYFFDDQERNLIAAAKFGIRTVHVEGNSPIADIAINNITDLDISIFV